MFPRGCKQKINKEYTHEDSNEENSKEHSSGNSKEVLLVEWVECCDKLLSDDLLYERMSKGATQYAIKYFSKTRMIHQLESILNE